MRLSLFIVFVFLLSACDPQRVYDNNKTIEQGKWQYENKLPFDVQVTDTQRMYNLYVNLRVGADYKYSNIFLWLHTTNPENKTDKRRVEFRLANQAGKFLGSGLGDLYDYQLPVIKNFRLTQPGFYRFELEQNMRDDTLLHVLSAGVRLEYSEP
jgi:gliding motility-associated lipoprotein GldH